MNQIEFLTEHRLSDTMALQLFVLQNHLLRRGMVLAVLMLGGLTITTVMNGAPLADSLADLKHNAGLYLILVLVGLVIIYLVALLLAFLAWQRLSKPRQIWATLTAEGLKKTAEAEFAGDLLYATWAQSLDNEEAAALLRLNGQEESDHANRLLKAAALLEG